MGVRLGTFSLDRGTGQPNRCNTSLMLMLLPTDADVGAALSAPGSAPNPVHCTDTTVCAPNPVHCTDTTVCAPNPVHCTDTTVKLYLLYGFLLSVPVQTLKQHTSL